MSKKKEVEGKKKINSSKQSLSATEKQISSLEKAQNFLSLVEERLVLDLDNQQINIPSKQIPLLKNDSQHQKHIQKQLKEVLHEKQQIRKKLKNIQNSQKILQAGLNLSRARDKSLNTLRPKSELSTEDIQKLKKLKQQQLKFEREVEEKTRQYKQKEKLYKQQQNQLIQKSKRQKNEVKKLQIEKNLQEMSERRIERAYRFQQQKKTMRKLKHQAKLHEQLAAKWQNIQKANQESKRKNYEQRKKQMSVDLTQIKEHEKKYEQIILKNREQINRKRLQTSKISRKIFKNHLHHSRFYTLVLQQDQKKKSSLNQKKQMILNLVERKKQFSEGVKQNHIPKLRIKQSSQSEEKQETKKTPLDFQQMRKKGLLYLKQAKSKANRNAFTQKNTEMNSFHEQKPKYKNYLTETRNKQTSGGKTTTMQRDYNIEVKEAKNIMKKTNFSDQQKIDRVKLLAQRMETYDTKTTKSSVLLQKIQAKMQILQTIQ